jgi:hypothetical protein
MFDDDTVVPLAGLGWIVRCVPSGTDRDVEAVLDEVAELTGDQYRRDLVGQQVEDRNPPHPRRPRITPGVRPQA